VAATGQARVYHRLGSTGEAELLQTFPINLRVYYSFAGSLEKGPRSNAIRCAAVTSALGFGRMKTCRKALDRAKSAFLFVDRLQSLQPASFARELQQYRRMRRGRRRLEIDPAKPKLCKIEPANKDIGCTNRIVLVNPIFQAF
jgi:hypothetical protein